MANNEEKFKVKLKLLEWMNNKTQAIIETHSLDKIKRHKEALGTLVKTVEDLKLEVEESKLSKGGSIEEIQEWEKEIEANIDQVDTSVNMLDNCIKEADKHAEHEKIVKEQQLLALQREETLKFEKEQLERAKFGQAKEKDQEKSTKDKSSVKLPKLVITRFDGKLENWLAFWNKYEAEIDSTDLPPVTKFAYLKELVEPQVRQCIDGLPFTIEGYERSKNILKSIYGKTSEIINAYVENITALPVISGSQPAKIHDFYKRLTFNVQSLETLGKTRECWSMVRGVLDKLPGIKAELVRGKPDWQTWGFSQLTAALREWTEIHPCLARTTERQVPTAVRQRSFQAQEYTASTLSTRECVYCGEQSHKSAECTTVKDCGERKRILKEKKLCFNCTGAKHRAEKCKSRGTCAKCKKRHHTSICDQADDSESKPSSEAVGMTATQVGAKVCHPVVIVRVNGVKCRALLDTGSTSTYLSSFLVNYLNIKPAQTLSRSLKTIVGLVNRRAEIYEVNISDTAEKCVLQVCATKVERHELLSLDNPNYPEILKRYPYLQGVEMEETATKEKLPIHVILGVNEYTKIKTGCQRARNIGEPIAEKTRFGWTIMTTGAEADLETMLLTQTATSDYEKLCRLDVLGLQDTPSGSQEAVHAEFIEQLQRSPEGWYETGLPWKGDHPHLPNNKSGSLKRLQGLVNKLKRSDQLQTYDAVIQEQLEEGIIEEAEVPAENREFYIPHKAVIRDNAETTKLRIVYDASAKANNSSPSLNDCLDIGPPLQNQLWKVLVRGRFHAVAIAGDIKKAFLQVRIKEKDRDALRFHWIDINNPEDVRTFRFTRALFGLGPSPFLLGGVIQQHLNSHRRDQPESVKEIENGLYVDDLILGGETVNRAREIKLTAKKIFKEAHFELHKWNSNARELELDENVNDPELSYVKEQLGTKSGECHLLGLSWNKNSDTLGVTFPQEAVVPTKRGVLSKIARVYDPLGLVAPSLLQGKLIYREACLQKGAWDAVLPRELLAGWNKWERNLPLQVSAPRTLVKEEPIQKIALHGFGDASGKGVAAAVYAVVEQETGLTKGLVAARARLAKQGLTIPRLELVAGHMTVNLLTNVREALVGFPVRSLTGWLDSSVALHWINGAGDYKQFVGNRVRKIREHDDVEWRHIPTRDNPADLGSRGGPVLQENSLWWNGPEWLGDPARWPPQLVTAATPETEAEVKAVKQISCFAVEQHDEMETLLSNTTAWRTLRVCAWMSRFIYNTKRKKLGERRKGPLTTEEIEAQRTCWEKRVQSQHSGSNKFKDDQLRLNLQPNDQGVLVCKGRIQGEYPIYLPDTCTYAQRIVEEAHNSTLHGGVGLTMAKVRERHWIPRLRRLAKRVTKSCSGCKRFQAVAFNNPATGPLPSDRTQGTTPFEVIGVDYMGPISYKASLKKEGKGYVLLYSCSLTRAVHLELLPTLETQEFIRSFKQFIARRGRPKKVYSDNGSTFVGAAGWLRKVMRDEQFNDYLAKHSIRWQFNLSRAPWWGGQFERMVGLVKRSLQKNVGRRLLTWNELKEVLLDVEVALNGRPLSYVEDDHELPVLTPNALIYSQSNVLPELEAHHEEDPDLRKRAKYLKRCKREMWARWTSEYVRGLRERHNLNHKSKRLTLKEGDVVIIKGDEKDRNHWKLGIVQQLIVGKDGVVRAAKLRAGRGILERAVQHLYPLELSCDPIATVPEQEQQLRRV